MNSVKLDVLFIWQDNLPILKPGLVGASGIELTELFEKCGPDCLSQEITEPLGFVAGHM